MGGILQSFSQGETVSVIQTMNQGPQVVTPEWGSGGALLALQPAAQSGATVVLAEYVYQPGAGPGGADQATVRFQDTGQDQLYWVAANVGWFGFTNPLLLLPQHLSDFVLTDTGQGLTMQVMTPPSFVQTAFQSNQFYLAFGFNSPGGGGGTAGRYELAATG